MGLEKGGKHKCIAHTCDDAWQMPPRENGVRGSNIYMLSCSLYLSPYLTTTTRTTTPP